MTASLALVADASDRLDVERAASFLAQCRSVDSVREVRDRARAIAVYQRTRGAAYEAQADAAEIALRAERRLGELCAELPVGRPGKGNAVLPFPSLDELGISRMQSSRWQQIASVPEPDFEAHVTETRARQERLTVSALVNKIRRDEQASAEPEPFHPLVAAGDFKDAIRVRVEALIKDWPVEARGIVPVLLRDLADEFADTEDTDGDA